MKRAIVLVAVIVMTAMLAACSSGSGSQGSSSQSGSSASSSAPASSASASSVASDSPASSAASSGSVGLADPWSDVATAEEAAKGAGIPSFTTPAPGTKLTVGPIGEWTYRCMEGIAEARAYAGVPHLTLRKGTDFGNGDISGDFNEYEFKWPQDVYGTEVICAGNVEGHAKKMTWASNDYCFSITVEGQGDDSELFGLNAEDVATLVSNTN